MIYRCLVADDNVIDRDLILSHLKKVPTIEVVAVCADGHEAAVSLEKNKIDIVFSDIDMPNLSGLGLKKSLIKPPVFVFITSHSEYAVESFNLDVIDFVVKPLTAERFNKAVHKAIEYIGLKKTASMQKDAKLSEEVPQSQNGLYFFIKETLGITKLLYSNVLYIESMGDYSKIYTTTGKHVTLVSLKGLEKQLPTSLFRRVHKQFIVNVDHVTTIGATEAHLSNNHVVPLGILHRQELIDEVVIKNKILSR